MFFFGSRSAQTSNESAQNSDAGGGGAVENAVKGYITAAMNSGNPVQVHHMWRKLSRDGGFLTPHHSQLFVTNLNGVILFNFGLWSDEDGKVVFAEEQEKNIRHYTLSDTYSPNPVRVTPGQLMLAFLATKVKCGPDYKQLHNNCQKFGRLFMTELGAKHSRSLFHL
ncbi:hypothetical protein [Stenotrophomonas sp. SY1]|uniref:hypothetical protein n=1 Tax=Stenotrophomonas sp. SY1 TaxID=477235 RepID=UPI001E2A9ACD|nr:hypothetical protein [Stenotrophomonas sp. SY1]MCD9087846.1 hypothetical protein [Stenotrophomonas sp. SY1]